MRRVRRPVSLALASAVTLAVAFAACSPAESVLAKGGPADVRAAAHGTWVLRRVDGAPLPARIQESADGFAELLADTLRFTVDSVHERGATRILARPPAGAPHDSVYTNRLTRAWRYVDGQVRVGEPPCGEPRELILCALPDTGRVVGDTLALATAYDGAPRRAYVRVDLP